MEHEKKHSWLLVGLETVLVLLAAFLASMVLGAFALFGTALVVEEDGLAAMIGQSGKLELSMTANEAAGPPSIEETRAAVQETIAKADVIVQPQTDGEWSLTAWFEGEAPDGGLGRLLGALQALGWSHGEPALSRQPTLMGAMENPTRMRTYVPPLMTMQALCFVFAAWAMLRWRKPPPLSVVKRAMPAAMLWGVGGALLAFVASSLIGGLLHLLGLEVEEQAWIRALMSDGNALLGLAPWLVLIGPISEEVFFRGYVFRRAYTAIGPGAGYALSALLFGVIHLHPVGIPMYAVIGLVFCWVHRRTGTLWAPVIAHVVYNGVVLIVSFFVGG